MKYSTRLAKDSCNWAINSGGRSNETNIKITKEIASLFVKDIDTIDTQGIYVKFLVYKEDFVKSLCQIFAQMPLALSKTGKMFAFNLGRFEEDLKLINDFFGVKNTKEKEARLSKPAGHSFCLSFGKDILPIREFCLEKKTVLNFIKSDSTITLRFGISKETDDSNEQSDNSNYLGLKRQIIFYGAPGTGKSYAIKAITGELENANKKNVFRTTFHPDTDYASFVGCYKPIPKGAILPIKTLKELKYDYKIIKESEEENYASKFGALYWNSLYGIDQRDILSILDSDEDYIQIKRGCEIGKFLSKNKEEVITYDFVPQIFTNAYVYAYKHPEIVTYLVIEEINRGNCAHIFGDLFQLLDRKSDGYSDYPIKADTDLQKYLEKELGKNNGFIDGKLSLPPNLVILSTMNTSDQSLFPIDSAFKRRWEWQYIPIEQPQLGEIGNPRNWKILANGHWCYWWEFLTGINEIIEETTHSEDKQLGYYFTKPDNGEYISAESFVSKIIFYLWNDVFKDEDNNIFKYKKLEGKWDVTDLIVNRTDLFFRNFILSIGDVNEKLVQWFINNILSEQKVLILDDKKQEPISQDELAYMRPLKSDSYLFEDNSIVVQEEENVDSNNDEQIENKIEEESENL